jgi:hypothetical protein
MSDFQAASGIQGRQFAEQCDQLLRHYRYVLRGRRLFSELGVEVDQAAESPQGRTVWFEYKGSVQGTRPGLLRTDTLKKLIANGALLKALSERELYVVLTSHLPDAGAGAGMLRTALTLGYLDDAICIYSPADTRRLQVL